MSYPTPRKFYYEEHSYMSDHYLIELGRDNILHLQETLFGAHAMNEVSGTSAPSPKQWLDFEKKLYSLNLAAMHQPVCDGTCVDIWITFKKRVKLSIQLGEGDSLEPLHLALNPLTLCEEFPQGLFPHG